MSVTTVSVTVWGAKYAVRADWAQASCSIHYWAEGDYPHHHRWIPTGDQVADYRHSSTAALRAHVLACQGEWHPTDDDLAELDAALRDPAE